MTGEGRNEEAGMELRTDRTLIRPWRPDEADRLLDIVGRPEVTAWLGDPAPWTPDQVDDFIAGNAAGSQVPIRRAIVPLATGVPVGTVMIERFKPLLGQPGDPHVGWYLHPDALGHGWASEAAAAMLRFAVGGGAPRVWAAMWPHNSGSANVARRIGLVDLGRQDDPWHGSIEYPLTRLFCTWRPDAEHPLDLLARLNAAVVREHASQAPPVGRDGASYPGPE